MTLRTAFGPFGPAISVAAFCAIFGAAPALAAEAEADGEAVVTEAATEAEPVTVQAAQPTPPAGARGSTTLSRPGWTIV